MTGEPPGGDGSGALAAALGARLSMQIALSSQPVVEEWMDVELTDWQESIPTPMEMPDHRAVGFRATVASDLSRLTWSAHGHPPGMIPKLATYLTSKGATEEDLERINAIGERFEPAAVGSWIHVSPAAVTTGWQFQDDLPLSMLEPILGPGKAAWLPFAKQANLAVVANLSAPLKSSRTTAVLPIMGEHAADTVESAFAELTEFDGSSIATFLRASRVDAAALFIGYDGDGVRRLAVTFGGVKSDDLASLCNAISAPYDPAIGPLEGALGAEKVSRLVCGFADGSAFADAVFVPGTKPKQPPRN